MALWTALGCSSNAPAPSAPPHGGAAEQRGYQQEAAYGQPAQAPPAATTGESPALLDLQQPPAADLPGLFLQLDQAEQALTLALAPTGNVASTDSGGDAHKSPGKATTRLAQGDVCSIACAALASMKRSANHVCDMAGENDSACGGARARVERAEERVTKACPSCSAPPG